MTKYVFVSEDLYPELEKNLEKKGIVVKLGANPKCYNTVNKHSDIQLLTVNKRLYLDDCINIKNKKIADEIKLMKNVTVIKSQLGNRYPLSVPFNGKLLENRFIHNLTFTDKYIMEELIKADVEMIHVKQGYTGCSLLLLKGKKGITADKGIYKTLVSKGFDILLIQEGHIKLPGVEYGFIGGCAGVDYTNVYINGDLDLHPVGGEIRRFIEAAGYEVNEVKGKKLYDMGSVIFWEDNYE